MKNVIEQAVGFYCHLDNVNKGEFNKERKLKVLIMHLLQYVDKNNNI